MKEQDEVLEPKPNCKDCGSPAVVKYGLYKGVQRYYCKSCKRKFKADDSLFHGKVSASMVSSALNMYYSGMSMNDIRGYLKQEHDYYPSKAVIHHWVDKYTQSLIKYFRNYHPQVSDHWIADETYLNMAGRNVFVWDIIDAESRFMLASRITYTRSIKDAELVMEEARKRAGKAPKLVTTDGFISYVEGIEAAFGGDTEHQQSTPFTNAQDSTNRMERWHGTLKERTKVMRGIKDIGSGIQFIDGFLAWYNFFRPHESLNGRTPAEAAKGKYPVESWTDLTHLPVTKQAEISTHVNPPKELRQRDQIPRELKQSMWSPVLDANGMPKLHRGRKIWR